jgi:hypothetical protein
MPFPSLVSIWLLKILVSMNLHRHQKNGFTTQNLYATYDTAQRGRMRDPKIQSYSTAFEIGKPVTSISVLAKVLKSDNPKFKEGPMVLLDHSDTETFSVILEDAAERAKVLGSLRKEFH